MIKADLNQVELDTEALVESGDDRRREESKYSPQAIPEVDQCQRPGPQTGEGAFERKAEVAFHLSLFLGKSVDKPTSFVIVEPVGMGGTVGEIEPADHAEHDRREPGADDHELPAGEAELAIAG